MSKRTKKAPKDKNAPKRPSTGYLLFTNDRREPLRKLHPDKKITEISKLIGAEWKILTPEQKKPYEDKAKADKQKYDAELAAYKKTPNYAKFQQTLKDWKRDQKDGGDSPVKGKKVSLPRKPKKPKDDNAPKAAQTGYFLFMADVREKVKAKNPEMKAKELTTKLGAMWKDLGEAERKAYNDKAVADKARYKKEMAEYEKTDNHRKYQKVLEGHKEELKKWKAECTKREAKAATMKSPKKSAKKTKSKKKKESSSEDSSSEEESSDEESSSGGESTSSSSS